MKSGKTQVPAWTLDEKTNVATPHRDAEFWKRAGGYREIECTLCYRNCRLRDGEDGWCSYRGNRGGVMTLHAHGQVTFAGRCMAGYQANPFRVYKPGQLGIFIGATRCTAGCSFCIVSTPSLTHRDPWINDRPGSVLTKAVVLGERRALLHPQQVITYATLANATSVCFGINEATLSYEYTYDVARLAKEAGLEVYIETNGFCGPKVARKLAPYVDAVDIGIKGSGDPAFYDRWMRSPGAMTTVLETAKAWREAGVFVLIGDVLSPPHMQDQDTAEASQRQLYGWIAENLGEHTPLMISSMFKTTRAKGRRPWGGLLLPKNATYADYLAGADRTRIAYEIAEAAGLAYRHVPDPAHSDITCHACGGVLLRFHPLWRGRTHRYPEPAGTGRGSGGCPGTSRDHPTGTYDPA